MRKIILALLVLLALTAFSRAADLPATPDPPTTAKDPVEYGPGGQVVIPLEAFMLGKLPGHEYAKEPSRPIISSENDFFDTREILKNIPTTWAGIPAVAVAPNGRLWVAYWIGGDVEHDRNIKNVMVLYTAANPDSPLEGPVVIPKSDYGFYIFQPCLWIDPEGRLWFTYVEMGVGEEGLSTVALVTGNPEESHPIWEKPRIITPGHQMNKGITLKNGDWIFPAEDFTDPEHRKDRLFISRDQGKTFSFYSSLLLPGVGVPELMTIEKNDGSLWMLTRTKNGIVGATSPDGGKTWQDIRPLSESGIQSPDSRFHITRLKSGRLLLVYNNNPKGRTDMTAALSDDDGKTWPHKLLLDAYTHVTYPDAQQLADGSIVIVYDKDRYKLHPFTHNELPLSEWGEIKLARITEEDILAGKLVSRGSFTDRVIRKQDQYVTPSSARFDFENSMDGWRPNTGCKLDQDGEPGTLTLTYHGADPYISSHTLNIVGGPGPLVVILRLKVSRPGNITIYYQEPDDKSQDGTHKIAIPVPPEAVEKWTEVQGELPVNSVKSVRLDPSGTDGKISIDWIEIRSL